MNAYRCLLFSFLVLGCGPRRPPVNVVVSGSDELPSQFPTTVELDKLRNATVPDRILDPDLREVETWTLSAVPEQTTGDVSHTPNTRWESALADAAQANPGHFWTSEAMHCVAKQYAQFYLSNLGIPANEVGEFIASRCAMTDTQVGCAILGGQVSAKVPDEQIFARTRDDLNRMIQRDLTGKGAVAGVAFARKGERAVVVLTHAPHRIRYDTVPLVPDADGHVHLRGEVLVSGQFIQALINYGRFGFKACVVEPGINMPHFGLDCETARSDESAVIEVGVFPPGHLTGTVMSRLLVWPSGTAADHYQLPSYGIDTPTPIGSDLTQRLTTLLNDVRKTAGLAAVQLEPNESATAAAVAPHYFAAMNGKESEATLDTIVLGLRAGWQVPGYIGYGSFTSGVSRNLRDAGKLLATTLDRPSGREALLNPSSRVIAIGPVVSQEAGVLGVVFSSYSFLEPTAEAEETKQVYGQLVLRRNERGRSMPGIARSLQAAVSEAAHSLEAGQRSPGQALQDALASAGDSLGSVQGYFVATDNYERLAFPGALLDTSSVFVAIGVAHYKPHNFPWAMRGVLILATGGRGTVASNDERRVGR